MSLLTFVTQNPNKIIDAQKLLPEFEINHVNFDVPEIQSLDVREIVKYKLQFAYKHTNHSCFVMDTSLSFDCLNGFPGPFIKWYYEKTVGAQKTCEIAMLFNQFGCQFTTTLGYFDGRNIHYITESINGTIPPQPQGANGFNWDNIFIPEGDTRTFAEMTFEEKHQYSVTAKIFQQFRELLG
jgi:non-canonical purine NTP pyrophosphatase (RdgB/HAM1 family)